MREISVELCKFLRCAGGFVAKVERIRQVLSSPFGADDLKTQTEQGWRIVAIEWEREIPEITAESVTASTEEPPFGLRVSDETNQLEVNPTEREALFTMMELTVQEGPYNRIAEELNRRGFRTRQGRRWSPISVFQMLPRLIEVGPRIFSTDEWQERRKKLKAAGQ
jgi:recombinase